jgi:hypothetical protein
LIATSFRHPVGGVGIIKLRFPEIPQDCKLQLSLCCRQLVFLRLMLFLLRVSEAFFFSAVTHFIFNTIAAITLGEIDR